MIKVKAALINIPILAVNQMNKSNGVHKDTNPQRIIIQCCTANQKENVE